MGCCSASRRLIRSWRRRRQQDGEEDSWGNQLKESLLQTETPSQCTPASGRAPIKVCRPSVTDAGAPSSGCQAAAEPVVRPVQLKVQGEGSELLSIHQAQAQAPSQEQALGTADQGGEEAQQREKQGMAAEPDTEGTTRW
jgi:hypothetical protein